MPSRVAGDADRPSRRRCSVRLLLRPLYWVLVRLSALLLPLPNGLLLWAGLPLRLSIGSGDKPGAGVCTGSASTCQYTGPAGTAAATVIMEDSVRALDWAQLDKVAADRLWLRPLDLLCGYATREAVAAGLARPLP